MKKFVKKTGMSHLVESFGYITALVAPDLSKAPTIKSDTTFRRSAVDLEDLKQYWISEKSHISLVINNPIN